MTPSGPPPEEQKVIALVWNHFQRYLKWPSHRVVMRECDDAGINLNLEAMKRVSVGDRSPRQVSLSFDTLLGLPEVRALLEPVPALLRLGAEQFIAHAKAGDKTFPVAFTHEDFARFWPDTHERGLARELFDMGPWHMSRSGLLDRSEFSYYCNIDSLRYETSRTLDEVLSTPPHAPPFQRGQPPSGPYLQLLQAIYLHAMRHGEWPVALSFAIEHRTVGFVKDLVEALRQPYLASGFGTSQHDKIVLTTSALPLVDHTGETRALFVKAIKTLHRLWKYASDEEEIISVSIADLSKAMEIEPFLALRAALFIQAENLWRGGTFNMGPSQWSISISDHVLHYQGVNNWEDYLAIRCKQQGDCFFWMGMHDQREVAPSLVPGLVLDSSGENLAFDESEDEFSDGQEREADDVSEGVDVVIVCALLKPELEKVMAVGNACWEDIPPSQTDPHIYYTTTYKTKKGTVLRVAASAPTRMGSASTTVLATKMILRFKPRLVIMVGIAAGSSPGRQGFGDILVADQTFDYDAGKTVESHGKVEFQPHSHPIPIDLRSAVLLKAWESKGTELDEISRAWPGDRPSTRLSAHVGPIGSGSAVLSSRAPILDVIKHWRKLVGIEMEAHAVHVACHDTLHPPPSFLCFKSICDFAEDKNDRWQMFAAYTAAEYCHRFLMNEWEKLHLPVR